MLLQLPNLQSLNLSNNYLSNLPIVEHQQHELTRLDLSNNHLKNVPYVIQNFPNLKYLNVSSNRDIKILPPWLATLESLQDLRIEGLPLLNSDIKGANTRGTIKYLQTQIDNTRKFYEMKLIVTGSPGTGKSRLVAHLQGHTHTPTHLHASGISTSNWVYRLSSTSHEYEFIIWDIAGYSHQEMGAAIEEVFYTPYAVYIVVLNLAKFENDLDKVRQRINAIGRRGLPSCVLFVGTHYDLLEKGEQDRILQNVTASLVQMTSQFTNQQLVLANPLLLPVSLIDDPYNIDQVRQAIFHMVGSFRCHDGQPFMGRRIPLSALGLKGEIEEYHRHAQKGTRPSIITYEHMEEIVSNMKDAEVRGHTELETITDFLNQVGCLLHFQKREPSKISPIHSILEDSYFMDPHWLYCQLKTIFAQLDHNHPGLYHYLGLQKLLGHDTIANQDDKEEGQQIRYNFVHQLIAVMVHFKLLAQLKSEGDWFMAPALLRNQLPIEMKLVVNSIHFPHCQTYHFKSFLNIEMWLEFLAAVLNDVIPAFPQITADEQGQFHEEQNVTLICWKYGIVWLKNEQKIALKLMSSSSGDKNWELSVQYTSESTRLFEDLVDLIKQFFHDNGTITITCPACIQNSSNEPSIFTIESCLYAVTTGTYTVTCSDKHTLPISVVTPLLSIEPTHTTDTLNLELKRLDHFSSTSSYVRRYTGRYQGKKVLVLKYHTLTEPALKELCYKSIALNNYNTPCLSNVEGQLLALAIDTKEAILVCQVPPLGKYSNDSRSENPVIRSRLVLHRIAVQLAKGLSLFPTRLRGSSIEGLQFWSLDERSPVHCSLVLADKCLKTLQTPQSDSNEPDQTLYDTWMYYMKQLYSLSDIETQNITYYLTKLLDQDLQMTPSFESLIRCFSSVSVQLVMDIQPLRGLQSPLYAPPSSCVNSVLSTNVIQAETWICSLNQDKAELRLGVYNFIKKAVKVFKVKSINPVEVLAFQICRDHAWLATQLPDDIGCVSIFNASTKELVHNIKMKGNVVTCIEHFGFEVCVGTKGGFLFVFPDDVYAVKKNDPKPRHKFIVDSPITGLSSIWNQLCIAHSNCIYLFDLKKMEFISPCQAPEHEDEPIGQLFFSSIQDTLYSVQFGSTLIRAWNVPKHLYDIFITKDLVSIADNAISYDSVITAFTPALDTIWVGLSTGFILVYHQGSLITWMHSYSSITFLSVSLINISENTASGSCCVASGGDGFLSPFLECIVEPQIDSQVMVLWKAYPKEIMFQLKALEDSRGSYLESYESLTSLIDSTDGFKDIRMINVDNYEIDVMSEETLTIPTPQNIISIQLPDKRLIYIKASVLVTIDSLMEAIQAQSGLHSLSGLVLVYHFAEYDTFINVSSDDELHCYMELPKRPNLILMEL